jgi:hypothetical protein
MSYARQVNYLSPQNQISKDLELLTRVGFWNSCGFCTNITSPKIVIFVKYFRATNISIIYQMTLRSFLPQKFVSYHDDKGIKNLK